MAVSLPSDIVMDVARAVDPIALQAARTELVRKAGGAGEGFAATLGAAGADIAGATRRGAAPNSAETYKKFEATVLTTFIQAMMPKDTEAVYGKGMSGDMWKSMLAGKLADAMEARGGIGIADRLLADHYKDGKETHALGPVSRGPERAEIDTQTGLSGAMVDELQRKAMTMLSPDAATPQDRRGA